MSKSSNTNVTSLPNDSSATLVNPSTKSQQKKNTTNQRGTGSGSQSQSKDSNPMSDSKFKKASKKNGWSSTTPYHPSFGGM